MLSLKIFFKNKKIIKFLKISTYDNFFFPSQGDPVTTLDSLWSHQRNKEGGMYKGGGGGPWPPRILNLYIYI